MKKIERRRVVDGRRFRFTNFVDSESLAFEAEARSLLGEAPIEQTLETYVKSGRPFFVMQMVGETGAPTMQVCVQIGHPRGFRALAMATVPKLWCANDSAEEEIGLRVLREFCAENSGAMTLRLQPQRFEGDSLMNFQSRALRQGYRLSDPVGTVRTRIVELFGTEDELGEKLPAKTRANLRHRGRERVDLRPLTSPRFLEACRAAAAASRERSGGDRFSYDFETAFALAAADPGRARIVGLFFRDQPEELMAFVIGFRRGDLLEYAVAGSFSDARLRSIPFNYFLLWELIAWARNHGCTRMDMGGVSDGGPMDPLRGITRFKRSFPGIDIETGREMVAVLKPLRFLIYRFLKFVRTRVGRGPGWSTPRTVAYD